ncbi:MAG TPA: hypothetical protein VM582_01600, partial [Candidatus Thermoplasmatota archaeon]|nr:hypothetical protein [Candidatus Thermoplasmatota archaeon]
MRRPRAAWLALGSLVVVASLAAADAPSAALLVETWDADTSAAWDATASCGSPANVVAAGAWRSSSPPGEPSCARLARRLAAADVAPVVVESRVRHAGPGVSVGGSTMIGLVDAQAPSRGVWIDVQSHASDTEVYLVDATGWRNLGGEAAREPGAR